MKVFLKWTATIALLGVLAYSGVWLEKKKINAMVEFPEVEVVGRDCIDLVIYVHEVGKQEINAERVLTLLDTLNVEHPHIVFAQMRLESGNFKSDLAKNNDNFLWELKRDKDIEKNNFESEEEVAECISDQLMHNYAWSVFEQHGCL